MAKAFPHRYETSLAWPGTGAATLGAPGRPSIPGGAPPEFDGEEGWWSPEHLLLSSLSLCFMTTFQAFARRDNLAVRSYRCHAQATLDKTPAGLGFTYLALEIAIEAAEEHADRVRDLVTKAKQYCIVSRALMPPVHVDLKVETPALAGTGRA